MQETEGEILPALEGVNPPNIAAIPQEEQVDPPLQRSQRDRRPPDRLTMTWSSEICSDIPGEILCLSAMYPEDTVATDDPILAYAASTDPDTMYYHEAMREPDRAKFIKAMGEEIEGQIKNGNFTIVQRDSLPRSARVLSAV